MRKEANMKKTGAAVLMLGAVLVFICMAVGQKASASIGVIGGADGPTAILVAGPNVSFADAAGILLGIVLAAAGWIVLIKKRK